VSPKVVIVVPVRADPTAVPRLIEPLGPKSALERTLAHALTAGDDIPVVLATDDQDLRRFVQERLPRVICHPRTAKDYVAAVNEAVAATAKDAEIVAILEATHPYRPKALVARTIQNLIASPEFDSVIAVEQRHGHVWREATRGDLRELLGPEGNEEPTVYFEQRGMALATRRKILMGGHRVGRNVAFEVIERIWTLADLKDSPGTEFARLLAPHVETWETQA